MGLQLTKNFNIDEFACNDKNKTPVPDEYGVYVIPLAQNLQVIRDYVGKPIVVSSGYRTPAWNTKVKGASNSMHLKAGAADIKIAGMTPKQVRAVIDKLIAEKKIYDGGVGTYATFNHIDVGNRRRW